jgi:hypothetical protein
LSVVSLARLAAAVVLSAQLLLLLLCFSVSFVYLKFFIHNLEML